MRVNLTAEQRLEIELHMQPGRVLIAKLTREQFDGRNAATSGTLYLEFGTVPEIAMPALREAIHRATNPPSSLKPSRKRKAASP